MDSKYNPKLIGKTVETITDPKAGAKVSRASERALLLSGIDMLRKTLDSAVSDLDTLLAAIAEGRFTSMTVEQAVDLLKKERALSESMIGALGNDLKETKAKHDDLFERAATASETLMKQEKELEQLRDELRAEKEENALWEQKEIERLNAERAADANGKIRELEEELAMERADKMDALTTIEQMQATIDDLRISLDSANRYGDQHRERLKQIEAGGHFKEFDEQIKFFKGRIDQLLESNNDYREKMIKAKAERDAALEIVRLALKLAGVAHA